MKVVSAEFIKGIRGTDPLITNGVAQVAFVGRSNVGKSSLIRALVGNKSLVKVSNRPGKTTELNFFLINKKIYLVDLPGYGYARVDPKEKEKLQKLIIWYLTDSGARPKRVVLVIDVKAGITAFDTQMLQILRDQGHPFIIAVNKVDKLPRRELAARLAKIAFEGKVAQSDLVACAALEPDGADTLRAMLFA